MDRESAWDRLSWDLTELILAHLPLRSLVRAAAVCKQWRNVASHSCFPSRAEAARRRKPWFFLYGQSNVVARNNRAFGFDPDAGEWVLLPHAGSDCFSGAGGFLFASMSSSSRIAYAPILRSLPWTATPPLSFSRCNPLVAVFSSGRNQQPNLIVVGGARYVGGLVDIEDRLAVEIYDPAAGSWELCPPLPVDFRSGNSSQWLSSALLPKRRLFFVLGIYSCYVSAFDLGRRAWTRVHTLRPPGVLFAFLVACGGDRLVLAGLCNAADGLPCFSIWSVDHATLTYTEIGVMPKELLGCLFESEDDDNRFASLKCVGLDGLVYIFNEDHHKAYPACVCEVVDDGWGVSCTWRKVPSMPVPVSRFHKVVAFCSPVPLNSVIGIDGFRQ
ncbi:F-box/kelch-repeat protein At3g24760 [Typha latifolia]|uniref:F-box/kelch-repeat protein At3g24760 n=1 Tax=Typha latifolia TaxID=4733 RepID=UPI003C2EF619